MKYLSNGFTETIEFAKTFSKKLKSGDVILLHGEMGAGKTVFTKGLASGLGFTGEVTSPTYAYMNDYDGKLYHFDCYRLSSGEDAEGLGLTDYFYLNSICVIEWSENIQDVLPPKVINITIKKIDENKREIEYDTCD